MFIGNRIGIPMMQYGTALSRLYALGGLLFYKDFRNGTLDAEYSVGSPTGIYTRSGGASTPTGYVNSAGVWVPNLSSNVPNFWNGYYDETGFHAARLGYGAFRSSTNLKTNTLGVAHSSVSGSNYSGSLLNNFLTSINVTGVATLTVVDIPELINISGAKAQRFTYVGVPGDSTPKNCGFLPEYIFGFAAGEKVTASFYVRSQTGMSATFRVVAYSVPSYSYTLKDITVSDIVGSEFKKYEVTHTIAAGDTGFYFDIEAGNIVNTTTVDFEIALPQIEKLPYATPYIQTAASALTRNADVLKWETAGNRNAAEETIIMGVVPYSTFANDGLLRALTAAETKSRSIYGQGGASKNIDFLPNSTDSSSAIASTTSNSFAKGTGYVISAVCRASDPNAEIYVNGTREGFTNNNFTENLWGTYFTVGCGASGTVQFDGFHQFLVVFNRPLTAAENAYVHSVLAGS